MMYRFRRLSKDFIASGGYRCPWASRVVFDQMLPNYRQLRDPQVLASDPQSTLHNQIHFSIRIATAIFLF